MELRSTEEARDNVETFSKRLVALMMDKKQIDLDIKALKKEFKEEGVPVGIVNKAITRIRAEMKKTEDEKFEEDTIQTWIASNAQLSDAIGALNEE